MKQLFLYIALSLFSSSALMAKVVSSDTNGFIIQIEKVVAADRITAYQQFIQVDEWWQSDHTWFGNSKNLSIDVNAGGCFCEIDGKKQVLHMTVTYVEPNVEIRLVGGLGPLQMMGITGGMSWKFETSADGKTRITHRYHVSGYTNEGLHNFAAIVDKVQASQVQALVDQIESN
jgi:hypothetical protein